MSHCTPFVHTSLLADVHCSGSLVRFEASSFCDVNGIGSSPEFLLVNLVLCSVKEILQLWISRTGHSLCPCRSQMMEILGWADSEPWIWAWVVAGCSACESLTYPHQQGQLPSTALARLPVSLCRRRASLSCSTLSSTMLPRQGTGCAPAKCSSH